MQFKFETGEQRERRKEGEWGGGVGGEVTSGSNLLRVGAKYTF